MNRKTKGLLIALGIAIGMRMLSSYLMKIGNTYYVLIDILIVLIFVPFILGFITGKGNK